MAKSITVVTPPRAAARVPVFQSSLETVPQKGSSRWTWTSTPPGMTSRPRASTIWTPGPADAGQSRPDRRDRLAADRDVRRGLSLGADDHTVGDHDVVTHVDNLPGSFELPTGRMPDRRVQSGDVEIGTGTTRGPGKDDRF